MKTQLLEKRSGLYLKRLAKEINSGFDAPYYDNQRVTGAEFSKGKLIVRVLGQGWIEANDVDLFHDNSGNNICASRKA